MIVKYAFVSWYSTTLVKAAGQHSLGGEVTGEKGPATEPEPMTYTLTRSFSHGTRHMIALKHNNYPPISTLHYCSSIRHTVYIHTLRMYSSPTPSLYHLPPHHQHTHVCTYLHVATLGLRNTIPSRCASLMFNFLSFVLWCVVSPTCSKCFSVTPAEGNSEQRGELGQETIDRGGRGPC